MFAHISECFYTIQHKNNKPINTFNSVETIWLIMGIYTNNCNYTTKINSICTYGGEC